MFPIQECVQTSHISLPTGVDNARRRSSVKGTSFYLFYDRLQSLERLKEVAQRSGGKRREFLPVSPHGAGDRHCSSTSGDCVVVLSRAQRWQDHIRECTEGANPWVPGFPAPQRNQPVIWVCKRNTGLLDLKSLLRLG